MLCPTTTQPFAFAPGARCSNHARNSSNFAWNCETLIGSGRPVA